MAPTILIVGATGNTGRGVVETLPKLLAPGSALSGHRIIALTRSLENPTAQRFAKLPGVVVLEKNWVHITADWLREHEVVRVFIASHNEPKQFPEESTFHVAALKAGVKYVVRISTTATNVSPDSDAYYPRAHWAIETLLGSPEFRAMQWTSLQPNVFSTFWLSPAAELIKNYRKTGQRDTLRLIASQDAPVGIVEGHDVGVLAAHLLAQADTTVHNNARYIVNGPEDLTGAQIVKLVEERIGTKLQSVSFKDLSFLDAMINSVPEGDRHLMVSLKHAVRTYWDGKCTASTTSKGVLELAAPTRTPAEVLEALLAD